MRTSLLLLTVSLLFPAGTLTANDSGCSLGDFKGAYAFYAQGTLLANNSPIAFAGTIEADGKGRITAWKDWVATPTGNQTPPFKAPMVVRDIYEQSGRDIRYTVEADCRIRIAGEVPGPAPGSRIPLVQVGGLAMGGKEALLINGSEAAPFLTVVTMKRAGPDRVENLLRKMAPRLGLDANEP